MRPDNTAAIIAAAQRCRELTRAKAIRALRELDHTGAPVTFEAVARAAGVSRSWLYAQPDIKTEIQQLRNLGARAQQVPIPSRQRSSDASLLRRLEIANKPHPRTHRRQPAATPPTRPNPLGHNHAGASHVALR